MNDEEHEEYLLGIAENVGELLVKPDNINHFRERVRSFQEEVEVYRQAVEEGRQADDPVDKILLEDPEDPFYSIFTTKDYTPFPRTEIVEVALYRSYIRLAVIHDKSLSEPVKIIEHNYSMDDYWIDRIWQYLSNLSTRQEYETGDKLRKAIKLQLKFVEYNLERATNDSTPETSTDTGQAKAKQSKGKRGRPVDTDVEGDKKIFKAWDTRRYKCYEDLALKLNSNKRAVQLAIDRHRKREKRKSEKGQ
ncbi:MAG: hypothetical protein KAJ46_07890 [Sedimentisphaerales bacterium]|nr:hypothetical protein [Sedimentisphaerales bacterium]